MCRRDSFATHTRPAPYRIKVLGRLGQAWASSFAGMDLESETEESGEAVTVLNGLVRDPSALHGLLMQLFDLGLTLVSVERTSGIILETDSEVKRA